MVGGSTPAVWYRVRDLDAGRAFYREQLGFDEVSFDAGTRVSLMRRDGMEIGIAEGEPEDGGVAHVEVEDIKAERERLAAAGVEVGVVLELHGTMRLLDVFDPDGNRVQLAQELRRLPAARAVRTPLRQGLTPGSDPAGRPALHCARDPPRRAAGRPLPP